MADGVLTELYEVKTNCERQTLYSAIGQMLVHDERGDDKCRRILVLPFGATIPDDVDRALKRANIGVLRFEINAARVNILD